MITTIFPSRVLTRDDYIEYVSIGEEAGLDSFWVGDHLNWYVPVLENLTMLGLLAGHTSLRLGSNVIIPALRQPYLLAKMAATIDFLAPGGYVLGLGAGGEHKLEFEAAGVPVKERGRRTDESLHLLRRLFSEDSVNHDGEFYHTANAMLNPRADLPIVIGGRSKRAYRRVAEHGDGWTAIWVTPSHFSNVWQEIRDHAQGAGRNVDELRSTVHVFVHIGPDAESSWRVSGEHLSVFYDTDPAPFRQFVLTGPPDKIAEGLTAYLDTDVDELLVSFTDPNPMAQMERFASEVMPLLERREDRPMAGRWLRPEKLPSS